MSNCVDAGGSIQTVHSQHQRGISAAYALIKGRMAEFADDAAGGVALMFGLAAVVLFTMIGGAIDMGRWLNAREQTLAATDSAVLAAGRVLQTGGTVEQAKTAAQAYFDSAVSNLNGTLKNKTIAFAPKDNTNSSFRAVGNASVDMVFLKLAGINSLPLFSSGQTTPIAEATIAAGGNSDTDVEIAMMLDVSGSMGSTASGSSTKKVDDMKAAAKDLVDIVVWADQSKHTSKVAIVPFSTDVNPPTAMLNLVSPAPNSSVTVSGKSYSRTTCVGERTGTNMYTDAPASLTTDPILRQYMKDGKCDTPNTSRVTPLSNDKSALTTTITNLSLGNRTGGHIGTAWAYYMLSPRWNTVQAAVSASSQAKPYGASKKIAVLMTDGAYNSEHDSKGLADTESGFSQSVNGQDSPTQAVSICADMKAKGIEVFTVGFDVPATGIEADTLKACATDVSHYYNAKDGEALKQAFREIALKISTLYLSK